MNSKLDLKSIRPTFKKYTESLRVHAVFIVIIGVLLVYLLVVWRISSYATAEPDVGAENAAVASIPKIDKDAIEQIQALEQNNTEIRSLFN
ncbi:MAG: hypothetical protein WD887_00540, partial [Candidatus Saccharimonadales bacterium]